MAGALTDGAAVGASLIDVVSPLIGTACKALKLRYCLLARLTPGKVAQPVHRSC